ncbi:MAG: hypothetical protein ACYTG6_05005, partial [Planctomycetota bacterium]
LTGRPPFGGKTLAEILTKVLYQVPTPPRVLNKKISSESGYLVERMMLKDPSLRYRTPAEVVRDIDTIIAGRSIIPDGFTGNWEAFLLRRRIRLWTKVAGITIAAGLLLGGGLTWYVKRTAHQRAVAAAYQDVVEAITQTAPDRVGDDAIRVREKLQRAREVLGATEDLRPERWDDLERQVDVLRRQVAAFEEFAKVETEVAELLARGAYAPARSRLLTLAGEIPGTSSPAERAVRDLVGDVELASVTQRDLVVKRAKTSAPESLDGLVAQLREHRLALSGDFIETPDLELARQNAADVLGEAERIQRSVRELEAAYSGEALAAYLDVEALHLDRLRRNLERQRRDVLDGVGVGWRVFAAQEWPPVRVVEGLVEARVSALERAVDAEVSMCWGVVAETADRMRRAGAYDEALALLERTRQAARAGRYERVRAEAAETYTRLEHERDEARRRADAYLALVEDNVRELVRTGRPAAIRARVEEALDGLDPNYPYRAEIAEMVQIADALERLQRAAKQHMAERRRLEHVRLSDGTVARRWEVVDVLEHAVIVLPTRGGARRTVSLNEIHPAQLLTWAEDLGQPLDPLARAVGMLGALPEQTPSDLRPLVADLTKIADRLRKAGYVGGLAGWVDRELELRRNEQNTREGTALRASSWALIYVSKALYESAFHQLMLLLRERSVLQLTDAFEEKRAEIDSLMAQVERELANRALAERLPGARIQVQGTGPDARTKVTLDWEDAAQTEVPVRGHGVLETYARSEPTTPRATGNTRLHLLRGMEGLQRDLPLAFPNVFDPAMPISLTFDYFPGHSPFFLGIDVDGLQTGVLSADPISPAYRERWRFDDDLPTIDGEQAAPRYDGYGRGRGVAFHAGVGFGDPGGWHWPRKGHGRNYEVWDPEKTRDPPPGELFAFVPRDEPYRVRVERDRGRITLYVDDEEIASAERPSWAEHGRTSDRDRRVRGGTGLLQIVTWTPAAVDNVELAGVLLEAWR